MTSHLVDTHTHLWDKRFDHDREARMRSFDEEGIAWVLEVGVDLPTSRKSLILAESSPQVYAAVGVHPHDVKELDRDHLQLLEELARNGRCVAVGEIGLDFYRDLSPRPLQIKWFTEQLEWALSIQKPVILHVRQAYEEVLTILEGYPAFPAGGVVHCFQSDQRTAERFIALGFYVGIGGPITYSPKINPELKQTLYEVVANLPLERILGETDCPYLTPNPVRGKRNEPAFVKYTVERIAAAVNRTPEETAIQLRRNAERLFLGKNG